MGSLWSHLISQGTDTQHLLSIFWLTVEKITLFSRKSSVDYSRDSAPGNCEIQLAKKPLGWSGSCREENEEKICASWACPPEKVYLIVLLSDQHHLLQTSRGNTKHNQCICVQLQRLLSEKIFLNLWSLLTAFIFSLSLHPKQVARKKK